MLNVVIKYYKEQTRARSHNDPALFCRSDRSNIHHIGAISDIYTCSPREIVINQACKIVKNTSPQIGIFADISFTKEVLTYTPKRGMAELEKDWEAVKSKFD